MEKEIKKNRSMTYLLPLVLDGINDINKKAIVNTYIYNINEPDLNLKHIEGLFILVSYQEESKETFMYNSRCIYCEDIDDKYFMVFIRANLVYVKDLNLLINSQYSKISDLSKQLIVKFYNLSLDSKQVKILTKNSKLKEQIEDELGCKLPSDQELGEKFEVSNEIYNVKFKKKINE